MPHFRVGNAVNTAGNFTGRIEPGDDSAIKIDHLRLFIDFDATHRVMNFRPDPRGVERRHDLECLEHIPLTSSHTPRVRRNLHILGL